MAPAIPGSPLLWWLGPLLVTLFAGYLRFDGLGTPKAVVFDETYYAKDALALLKFGWEHNTVENADKMLIADPDADIWAEGAAFVAHPPSGKWMIAIGEWLFGATPFGWRFLPALVGDVVGADPVPAGAADDGVDAAGRVRRGCCWRWTVCIS